MSTTTQLLADLFHIVGDQDITDFPWTEEFVSAEKLPPFVVRADIVTLHRFASYTANPADRKLLLEEIILFMLNDGLPPDNQSRSFYLEDGTVTYVVMDGLFQVFVKPLAAETTGATRHTLPMNSRRALPWKATTVTPEKAQALILGRFTNGSDILFLERNLVNFDHPEDIARILAESIEILKEDLNATAVFQGLGRTGAYVFVSDNIISVVTVVQPIGVRRTAGGSELTNRHWTLPVLVAFPEWGVKIQQSSISGAHRLPEADQLPFRMADLVKHTGSRVPPFRRPCDEPVTFPWDAAVRVLHLHLVSELVRYENMSASAAQTFITEHYEMPDAKGILRKHMESILQKGLPLSRPRGQW